MPAIITRFRKALGSRPHILLLDSCEHLLPKAALILHRLLVSLPTLTCLVTSRHRLNLPGEYEYVVPLLATPARDGPVEHLEMYSSVQVFVDRARAVDRGFRLTPGNAAPVAAICRNLEGVPLALELAAAWARALTPQEIAARLTGRLDFLANSRLHTSGRHVSLRATLDWSFKLLSPEVQRFLALVSVFRGGWTLDAAESVCEEQLALEYLVELQESSLVTACEKGIAMRFSLLDTVREYALERLTAAERSEVAGRHQTYYAQLAEEAEPHLSGNDQAIWLDVLDAERDNMRLALHAAPNELAACDVCLRMASSLWRFWRLHGDAREGSRCLAEALARMTDVAPDRKLKALKALGHLTYSQGEYTQAAGYYEQVITLATAQGDTKGIGAALGSLGNVAHRQGSLGLARDQLMASMAVFETAQDARRVAIIHGNLASLAIDAGEYDEASQASEQSLVAFRKLGDVENLIIALNNGSELAIKLGDAERARLLLDECLQLVVKTGNRRGLAQSLDIAVSMTRRTGSTAAAAARIMGKVEGIREDLGIRLCDSAQMAWQELRADLRLALGNEDYEESLTKGTALTDSEAVQIVLGRLAA